MHPIARHAARRLRHHAREVWDSRGGGFYGFVAMVTFLWLEGVNLVGDLASLRSLELSFGSVISWFVQNTVQGLLTVVWAAIWPATWVSRLGVGVTLLAALGGSYVVYRVIHPTVDRLLGEDDE